MKERVGYDPQNRFKAVDVVRMDLTLLFFFALAAFLSYKLFTVLGTRGGHEPEDMDQRSPRPYGEPRQEEQRASVPVRPADEMVPDWVSKVRNHYPAFDPDNFVTGAKSAYEMIVQGFASGDLKDIRPYLAADVFQAFDLAVENRKNAGQTMDVTFVGLEKAEVTEARDDGDEIEVVVAFQSDQIRVTRDSEGTIIEGDPNRIDLVKDRWTFSRPKNSRDPNWILTATDGAASTAA